jgi:hypothetical protein
MHEPAARILEHWGEFYLLVGTAAAALVALLFVAASIGAETLARPTDGPTRTYMSPIAFHFTSVLFVSALGLVPSHTRLSLSLLVGVNAAVGIGYTAFLLRRLFTDHIADLADRFGYGLLPLLAYVAGLGAAWLIFRGSIYGPEMLAATVVLLLVVNIRNTWDLMLSLSRLRVEQETRTRASATDPPG